MSKTAFNARNSTHNRYTTKWGLVLFIASFLPFISPWSSCLFTIKIWFLCPLIQPLLYTKNAEQLPPSFQHSSAFASLFSEELLNSNNHLHSESLKKCMNVTKSVFVTNVSTTPSSLNQKTSWKQTKPSHKLQLIVHLQLQLHTIQARLLERHQEIR